MNDSENREVLTSDAKPNGGLYSKINMSVRTANILVAVVLVLLVGAGVFVIRHNGFTVSFETDGGSAVESVKVMHSELVGQDAVPVKEGWVFTGWYSDPACTQKWDLENDTVTGSMTLYAGWQKKE